MGAMLPALMERNGETAQTTNQQSINIMNDLIKKTRQSDTPRTDAAAMPIDRIDTIASRPCNVVHEDVCRQLERELAEVTKQRDALAEALRKCREDSIINHDRMKKCGYTQAAIYCQENADRAYKALAAVKGGKQ